jgi:transcriptional regulator with XRE-family HTH domain
MSKTNIKFPNSISAHREKLGFTQDQLAFIVGCRYSRSIRRFESGRGMPGALMVLRLGAALRVPVDSLYAEAYKGLREEVRATEERMPKGQQGMLPLPV